MYYIQKNFVPNNDVEKINNYIQTIKFHTKENHVELHNNLFDGGAPFDIHTRGEMPDDILSIFSNYSKKYWELVSNIQSEIKYHPPMFSKHYIARFRTDSVDGYHFADLRPERTFGSYIYWNSDFEGGELCWEKTGECIKPIPGDLVFFEETENNRHKISEITKGYLFLSESWMSPVGTCPDPNVAYDSVDWDNWEIKGFYE